MAFFAALGIIAVLTTAFVLLQPSAPDAKPGFLDDDKIPKAEEGSPIPVIFGTVVLESPNVVWYGDPGYSSVKSDGK